MDSSQPEELLACVMTHIGEKYENLAPHKNYVYRRTNCELVKSEHSMLVADPDIIRGRSRLQGITSREPNSIQKDISAL